MKGQTMRSDDAPVMKLWRLAAINPQEPPFHFSSTPSSMVIVADSERAARSMAVSENGRDVWADETCTRCEEMALETPMILARDMGV